MPHTIHQQRTLSQLIFLLCVVFFTTLTSYSLPANHYAEHSVLSCGKWIKISTTEKGIHRIDATTLQSWGFNDASRVGLYGKEGYMLPETFSTDDSDDLAPIPVYVENGDLYFYATGGIQWEKDDEYYKHTNNYYTNIFYYFLTEVSDPLKVSEIETVCSDSDIALITFDEHSLYENELICIGQTGRLYLGEDLINNNTISIELPGLEGNELNMYVALGANSSSTCKLTTYCDGTALSPVISVAASDSYSYLKLGSNYYKTAAKEKFDLSFKATTSGTLRNFYLDYVRFFYPRRLAIGNEPLHFRRSNINGGYFALDIDGHNSNNIRVWDVTDASHPAIQKTSLKEDKIAFTPIADNEYVAFDITHAIATPQYVCNVENQDLHGIDYIPDIVIVTTRTFIKEAERIAQLHRDIDNMKVLVCEQLSIFNEFSGGNPDATAIRRMMKMFYDRANGGYGDAPRYLLLYGRSSYNNRAISPTLHNEDNRLLVTYQSESSTDQRYSYITDDYFGILGDNTGYDITKEEINLSIGRIPVKNMDESQRVYNKLITYVNQKPVKNLWKNKACFIALNGDNNLHVHQMNTVSLESVEKEQEHVIVDKIYLGAYNSRANAPYEGAQEQLFHDLEEGTMIYSYMGHAGHTSLGNNLLNITHAKELSNNLWPVIITATCDVCPFDKDENSLGEELFRNDKGGFIGLYTTTRTVYTNGNEDINRELLHEFYIPEEDGKIRLGDVMRRAKKTLLYNDKGNLVSDPNKLKYCLIGDPALSIPRPTYRIKVESINGTSVSSSSLITVPANSQVTLTGTIYDSSGKEATDYNGTLCYEIYDAEEKKQAKENINTSAGNIMITEDFGIRQYKLATMADTIINGQFTTTFTLPSQTLQSEDCGFITLYAFNNDLTIEAAGYSKNMVINGINNTPTDVTAPMISNLWIGDESFCEGGKVANNTLFHCDIQDDQSGLCNNELTIGRSMSMSLDGKIICNDLAGYYAPACEFGKGSIDYPLRNLSIGTHHATIKVFDNAGNASEATIAFFVEEGENTQYEICIDEDPITTHATISIAGTIEPNMTIRYVVVNKATGNEVWTNETTATKVTWNLTAQDSAITPGEYYCYALIGIGNNRITTDKKKIIVLAQ